jgi:hypothetical protein
MGPLYFRFQKELLVQDPAPHQTRFEWQDIIREVLAEPDPGRLQTKIAEAESAIFGRLQTLGQDAGDIGERNALQDASNTLLALKSDVLKYPDWRF